MEITRKVPTAMSNGQIETRRKVLPGRALLLNALDGRFLMTHSCNQKNTGGKIERLSIEWFQLKYKQAVLTNLIKRLHNSLDIKG